MNINDLVTARHKSAGTIIHGRWLRDNSGDTEHPPTWFELSIEGVKGHVQFDKMEWELKRRLPTSNGSLITHEGKLLVLFAGAWWDVNNASAAWNGALEKLADKHTLLLDTEHILARLKVGTA